MKKRGNPNPGKKTGSARMIELAMKPMQLWFTPQEMAALQAVADQDYLTRAAWVKRLVMRTVRETYVTTIAELAEAAKRELGIYRKE